MRAAAVAMPPPSSSSLPPDLPASVSCEPVGPGLPGGAAVIKVGALTLAPAGASVVLPPPVIPAVGLRVAVGAIAMLGRKVGPVVGPNVWFGKVGLVVPPPLHPSPSSKKR